MPKIYVRKAFVLQHEGEKHEFAVATTPWHRLWPSTGS